MREVGLGDMALDEEDPSEDWVALSQSVNSVTVHTPNGPLGSDRPGPTPVQGIEIAKSKKKRDADVPPLTNSVQENFRGFTYHGESIVAPPAGLLAEKEQEEAVDEAESPYPTTDDEVEDDSPAGRYAKSRRKGGDAFDGFDEDMHI